MNFHSILESRIPLFFCKLEPYKFVDVFDRTMSNCVCTFKSGMPRGWSFLHLDRRAHRSYESGEAGEHRPTNLNPADCARARQLYSFRLSDATDFSFSSCTLSKHLLQHHPVETNSLSFAKDENISGEVSFYDSIPSFRSIVCMEVK